MKIAQIVGARPQFIKYYPISKAVEKFNVNSGDVIKNVLIHTGQHYDYTLSEIFFNELGIKEPDYHLGVGSISHGEQTGLIIQRAEQAFFKEKPDVVLVYGDTNSTLGGALAAVKLNIPVAHIEAGLRSYNRLMPEEINRVLTDHMSFILLCPTETAVNNLQKEGFRCIMNNGKLINNNNFHFSALTDHPLHPFVANVGDVMYDVLLKAMEIVQRRSKILEEYQITNKEYYLLTLHRAENTDVPERLEKIINFVNDVSVGKTVICPMHPRTMKVYGHTKKKFMPNIKTVEPVGYFDILMLMKNTALIMTDSGGMQKEAYWLQVPCVTLREETEWVETVQSGWNVLYRNYNGLHKPSDKNTTYYGDGKAAERIVRTLITNIQVNK